MDTSVSSDLSHEAIQAALEFRWEDAIYVNNQILKTDPQNIDALSRMAKAYAELGKTNLAQKYYMQVLSHDPYNPIALKNLKIIKAFKAHGVKHVASANNGLNHKLSASLFLQEPGKTKIVSLLKVAEPQKLSITYCGMKVEMITRNRKLIVVDSDGGYLGVLPDDICHHLLRLIKGGNKYDLFIQSIRVNGLSILIREVYRSKKFKNQASFLGKTINAFSSEMISQLDEKDEDIDEGELEES